MSTGDMIDGVIKELKVLQEVIVPAIEELEEDLSGTKKTLRAADTMLMKVVRMKIDGYLDGEYDLADQQELREAALEYIRLRYHPDVGIALQEISWELGRLHPVCYIGEPDCVICAKVKEIRELINDGAEL